MQDKTRSDKQIQDNIRLNKDKTTQYDTIQDKENNTIHYKTRQDKTRQHKTQQHETIQGNTR